jgi:hypothetical protein
MILLTDVTIFPGNFPPLEQQSYGAAVSSFTQRAENGEQGAGKQL